MLLLFSLAFALAPRWDVPLLKLENQATEIKREASILKETASSFREGSRVEKIPELIYTIEKLNQKIKKSEEIFKNIEID